MPQVSRTRKLSLEGLAQKGKLGVVEGLEDIGRRDGLLACIYGVFIGAASSQLSQS